MKRFARWLKTWRLLPLVLGMVVLSCTPGQLAAAGDVLDKTARIAAQVSKYVADGSNALSLIQEAADLFFMAKPAPDVQAAVNDKIQASRLALSGAARATEGVQDLDTGKADAAFAEFRAAFADLEALAKQEGILSSGKLAQSAFPEPLAAQHFDVDAVADAEFAKKKPTCATAYAQELHLGCQPADGPAWKTGSCSKLTAAQVSCVSSAKSCLAVLKCEGN